jgi:hypothetical protein
MRLLPGKKRLDMGYSRGESWFIVFLQRMITDRSCHGARPAVALDVEKTEQENVGWKILRRPGLRWC